MKATLIAEFRKLLTIRSTYIVSTLALLLGGFFAFWGVGYKGAPSSFQAADVLQNASLNVVSIVGIFIGVVAILAICHEYRYNTIMYTLSISNSRMRVLFAKLAVVTTYAAVLTLITAVIAALLVAFGASLAGYDVVSQRIEVFEVLWRILVFGVGSAWLGLVLGFLFRNVVFAIAAYLMLPTLEQIMNALLKVSNNYMPNGALNQVMQTIPPSPDMFSPLASAGVFAAYVVGALIIASLLFVRRDAN